MVQQCTTHSMAPALPTTTREDPAVGRLGGRCAPGSRTQGERCGGRTGDGGARESRRRGGVSCRQHRAAGRKACPEARSRQNAGSGDEQLKHESHVLPKAASGLQKAVAALWCCLTEVCSALLTRRLARVLRRQPPALGRATASGCAGRATRACGQGKANGQGALGGFRS